MKTVISARAMVFVVGLCLVLFGPGAALAQTSNTCISPLNSDFYTRFEVIVEVGYDETNAAGPVPSGSNSFEYAAIIQLSTNLAGTASAAVLTLPGQSQPTLMREVGNSEFALGGVTNSFSNVLSVFPDGAYLFTISNTTISVTLPSDSTPPNPPTLVNFAGGQAIDATKDYNLRWSPFITGGVVDFIGVNVISDLTGTVFKSEDFGCPGALDGTATSILIPANTLTSNTTYRADITFVKVYTYDTNSSPGKALLAGTEAETEATLVTGPILPPAPAPVLTNAALLPGGQCAVRYYYDARTDLQRRIQSRSQQF